ncbi:hypothetical protein AB0933_32240 [Streptomyces venezuelae]|uniref:hypothetical protein n=1 Tax=Streptomyces venezuelae TaxID=54571 RepID=UPI003454DD6B
MDRNDNTAMGPNELAAMELFHQLLALSPEGDETTLRLTVRLGNSRFIGDVLLSAKDVAALNDALVSLNAYRADLEDETAPADEPPPTADALPPVADDDVTDMVNALENLANGGA